MPTLAVIIDDKRGNWTVERFTSHDEALAVSLAAKCALESLSMGNLSVVVPLSNTAAAAHIACPADVRPQDAADVVPVAETDEKGN